MPSTTNISFPKEIVPALREAVEFYGFENLAQFLRLSGYVIIQHYQRGDSLITPYAFNSVPGPEGKKS